MSPCVGRPDGATWRTTAVVSLALNTSRQFRSIAELTGLVQAISTAVSTESEPDWLEWKREADLSDRGWHMLIAKFVAGSANRDPSLSRQQAGGCAYLVLGAEPGNVGGVRPVDNAKLHAGVSRFVGTAARWSPQYIAYEGQQVLVITVEPPEYGDPIRAMLTAYEPNERHRSRCRRGDVFLRRYGRTDLATQADYDMLVHRFAAGAEQARGISVQPLEVVTAVAVACGPNEIRAWRRRQGDALLAPLEQRSRDRAPVIVLPKEDRSVNEYLREVDSYLDEVAPLLPREAHAEALTGRDASMRLVLINGTEHNFAAVRVDVTIDGDVWAYRSDADARPEMPRPPRKWGTFARTRVLELSSTIRVPGSSAPEVFGPYIDNSESTAIGFDDVDLRPGGKVDIDPIHLVADAALAGTTLTARWTATSTSKSGVAYGEFQVAISPDTVSSLDQ